MSIQRHTHKKERQEDKTENRSEAKSLLERIVRGRAFTRRKDGRAAYLKLYEQYLGPDNVQQMASMAETTLQTTVYKGETRNFSFQTLVDIHIKQHTILQRLADEHDYTGITEGTKVRHLNNAVRDP